MDSYDKVLLNSDIYLAVRDFHVNSMRGCRTVLDSGAGTGNVTLELLGKGKTVHAIDPSRKATGILRRKCAGYGPKLRTYCTSAEQLPFSDGKFDGVTSMFVVHFVDDTERYIREHYRVLSKKGTFALTGRVSGEHMEKVVRSYADSLKKRGLLPGLAREMEEMKAGILGGVSGSVKARITAKEMAGMLEAAGFRNIEKRPNPYFGQCYSLVAKK